MAALPISGYTRRHFLRETAALGGASLVALPRLCRAEPKPETSRVRIHENTLTCVAAQLITEDLLRAEGFTEIRYVRYLRDSPHWPPEDMLNDEVDISFSFPPTDIRFIEAGAPVAILAAAHVGCVELVASDPVRTTRDLKGRTVAIDTDTKNFIAMFAAYVGLNPERDINWLYKPWGDWMPLFTQGRIDAFMCSPPLSVELRNKKLGHALVNTTTDKPWSQYSCCLIASTKDFVHKHPVATKRAMRAILKGVDLCASDPGRVARFIADRGLGGYDIALQGLREVPFGKWREIDTVDSVRFWALRMHDVGAIKSSPQQIIARSVDLRFLNELKRELKT